MDILVQKYGGTSVNSPDLRDVIVENLQIAKSKNYECVIVVSAMGREGEPYSTDSLLKLMPFKTPGDRETDMCIACGEIISASVVAAHLKYKGIKAEALTGGQAGILTDDQFGSSSIISIDPVRILNLLKQGITPVVTGFQGYTAKGDITTLGRGGSDISAVALGGALGAKEINIFTDVDGVMSADPKVVANAILIESIDYGEVFQLAEYGGKVIHPRAVEYARDHNLSLKVLNTRKYKENIGTLISGQIPDSTDLITAITHEHGKVQVELPMDKEHKNVLEVIAHRNISIDMINIFVDHSLFIIAEEDKSNMISALESMNVSYKIKDECTKITLIGSKIKGVPGIMAKAITALNNKVDVLQTSDSHTTISILVGSDQAQDAIVSLHDRFKGNR
ncbi:aspartate kinase [Alkalibacter mobilis]|uniref:aspartate kinase n=1 Tax=Alkalibacter mobilis TaxID=2787712 RepID=UPI00189E4657|nr:aspartate kinase [Alkalibacter mobilis]MBF7095711.1 aspartate kinase [Alkalibacter mobilis]